MHPLVQKFVDYWEGLKRGNTAPLRADFSIRDVPTSVWGRLDMMEVERDPLRFKFTVFGTKNMANYAGDITGHYLDEIDVGGKGDHFADEFRIVCETKAPRYKEDFYIREDGAKFGFEGGCFPLLGDDGEVSHLIIMSVSTRDGIASALL